SVILYFSTISVYENLSKSVAGRAWQCALSRLASAKVRQGFGTAKPLQHFFQKKINKVEVLRGEGGRNEGYRG
ncbi:hypothetical protein MR642_06245, partial [bacterium]|nr:hypothetical protein [bacterium]